jgi:acetyl esterase/lipase
MIFVHGGAWVSGSASDYGALGDALKARGLCTVLVDYRLAPEYEHPAPVEDLDSAIAKLKKNPPEGCDPGRIFLSGHSAGAHMIAFWATKHADPSVIGFIGIEGIYNIPELVAKWPAYEDQFITSEFGNKTKWKAASPALQRLKNRAPWLIIHSKLDELVDTAQSSGFQKHLNADGIDARLEFLNDGSHFGALESLKNPRSAASLALQKFIGTQARSR